MNPRQRASAFTNERAIIIVSQIGYGAVVIDPSVSPHMLSSSASDQDIGQAVGSALRNSRFLSPREAKLFLNRDRVKQDYEALISALLMHYGCPTRKEFFMNMLNCSIECVDELIEIRPTSHSRLEAWSGDGIDESMYVHIPSNADADVLGAGVKRAFMRCKGRP